MNVFIEEYSTRTGKGVYRTPEGAKVGFSYPQFAEGRMIPAGCQARLQGSVLHPVDDGWFRKLIRAFTGR